MTQEELRSSAAAIESEVRSFIDDNFPLAGGGWKITGSESLLDAGILDSTAVLELVGFLESHFRIAVPDSELTRENFDSLDGVVAFVQRNDRATDA